MDGGSARRKVSTYTQESTNIEYTHKDIHASSGILTHDLGVRTGGDSTVTYVLHDAVMAR
jgi:hypothetical protein